MIFTALNTDYRPIVLVNGGSPLTVSPSPMMTPMPHRYPTPLVYDILFRVFFYLDEFKGTLRSAGLVCQAWYEPAMDVLWAENISLHNLLAILSPMGIKGDGWRNIAFFTRPPTPQS
ncbi:hypothetical protein FRB94_013430 [Tulasnella sp. JGI-2019a]|nr:hypothetical protein FRB94_013430 [Tulasnella sp. JGI-2019a]KAG9034763.1 hypothetical protein FRB95_012584 [Tulasnella sp. JGI-2019a]